MGYDGKLKFDTAIDSSGFNAGINKLGTLAKTGIGILAGYVTSFAALTKSAVNEVASLEQNIGGIETLFGTGGAKNVQEYAKSVGKAVSQVQDEYDMLTKAQTLALENANKAYETAGMSANEYMSTVTSFAASLKQSVSDEVEAAESADKAVIDMADNANKMGTNMELIQNAYQGFAKQNYTMLDNLKLGYGGTKEEMKRLLLDAEKLSGVKYDINNLNDVYSAIHVIQTELGITGTTAKEAATTIEGSMNSAKAAWSNFLAGTGTPEQLATAIDTAAGVLVKNIGEIAPRLAETVPAVAEELVPTILELGPVFAKTGLSIMQDFVSGMIDTASQMPEKAGGIVESLIVGINEKAPLMIAMATKLIADFITGLASQLPQLIPQALQMVVTLADSVISNIPIIVDAGLSLLKGLAQGIIDSLPTLISEGPRIINDFANAIYSALGELIKTGLEIIVSLVQGLWENKELLLENAGEIFLAFINIFSLSKLFSLGQKLIQNLSNGIKNLLPNIAKTGEGILKSLISGIKNLATHPVATVKEIFTNAMNAIKNLDWRSIGKNIISGIANGLKNSAGAVISAAEGPAKSALNAAKKFLGIHSPSTVFRDQVGKNMALGVGVGFEKNIPVEDMTGTLSDSVQRMQRRVSVITKDSGVNVANQVNRFYTSGNEINDNAPEDINLNITNVFEVDSTKLVEKTTKATIKKMNDYQKKSDKVKGKKYEEVWI